MRVSVAACQCHVQCRSRGALATCRHNGTVAQLPAHIIVDDVQPLSEVLANGPALGERVCLLTAVCRDIMHQLQALHRRRIVLGNICTANVVRARVGGKQIWTMLEYCSHAQAGTSSTSLAKTVPVAATAPEVRRVRARGCGLRMCVCAAQRCLVLRGGMVVQMAQARLETRSTRADTALDMWQTGVVMYEIAMAQPYWDPALSDADILRVMADPTARLPHELAPVLDANVNGLLACLLTRDASQRMPAAVLRMRLDAVHKQVTMGVTINSGAAVLQERTAVMH